MDWDYSESLDEDGTLHTYWALNIENPWGELDNVAHIAIAIRKDGCWRHDKDRRAPDHFRPAHRLAKYLEARKRQEEADALRHMEKLRRVAHIMPEGFEFGRLLGDKATATLEVPGAKWMIIMDLEWCEIVHMEIDGAYPCRLALKIIGELK